MKLSKKILGAVLCGLIVVGGSQLTLVKANAQTQWCQYVSIRTHAIGFSCIRYYKTLELKLIDEELKLEGNANVPVNQTFDDLFMIKLKRAGEGGFSNLTTFRECWQADAGRALSNVERIVNSAHIKVGDMISIHGEKHDDSVEFPASYRTIKEESRINHNNYDLGYKSVDRHHTVFLVTDRGLVPTSVYETL